MYLLEALVLYIIDTNTRFITSCFFCNIKVNIVWEAFKRCWLNIYFGLLDVVSVNIGINFIITKFKVKARFIGIIVY